MHCFCQNISCYQSCKIRSKGSKEGVFILNIKKKNLNRALTLFLASSCVIGLPACSGTNVKQVTETVQAQSASETVTESAAKDNESVVESENSETLTETLETESETKQETSSEQSETETGKNLEETESEDAESLTDVYVGSKDLEEQANGKMPDTTVYTLDVRAADYNTYFENLKDELDTVNGYIAKQDKSFYSLDEKKASLVLRVPRENSSDTAKYIQGLGIVDQSDHVTDKVQNMVSVINNHVTALQQEQTNLLEMAIKAEDTSTVLSIQSRIADITYEINAYNSKMHILEEDKPYDSIIINFTEDKDISFVPRVNNFFRRFITGIGRIFLKVAVVFCAILPIAVIIGLIIFICKIVKKKQQEKETRQIADYAKRISTAKNKGKVVEGSALETDEKKLLVSDNIEKESGNDQAPEAESTENVEVVEADSQEKKR